MDGLISPLDSSRAKAPGMAPANQIILTHVTAFIIDKKRRKILFLVRRLGGGTRILILPSYIVRIPAARVSEPNSKERARQLQLEVKKQLRDLIHRDTGLYLPVNQFDYKFNTPVQVNLRTLNSLVFAAEVEDIRGLREKDPNTGLETARFVREKRAEEKNEIDPGSQDIVAEFLDRKYNPSQAPGGPLI